MCHTYFRATLVIQHQLEVETKTLISANVHWIDTCCTVGDRRQRTRTVESMWIEIFSYPCWMDHIRAWRHAWASVIRVEGAWTHFPSPYRSLVWVIVASQAMLPICVFASHEPSMRIHTSWVPCLILPRLATRKLGGKWAFAAGKVDFPFPDC